MNYSIVFLFLIMLFSSFISAAQNDYILPKGFKIIVNQDSRPAQLNRDFDNDGILDLVVAVTNIKEEKSVIVYLSTRYFIDKNYFWFPWESNFYSFSVNNGVLSIIANLGTGRYLKTLKFKYYSTHNDMRLIGYDESYLGTATLDGAYTKTINLITNEFDIKKNRFNRNTKKYEEYTVIKKRSNIPLITLGNVSQEYLDYLQKIGESYL